MMHTSKKGQILEAGAVSGVIAMVVIIVIIGGIFGWGMTSVLKFLINKAFANPLPIILGIIGITVVSQLFKKK